MSVTLLGIVTEVKPLQPRKAALPIDLTELEILMEVRLSQPENAYSPMFVIESPSMYSCTCEPKIFLRPYS